jgi:hypothetical protein
MTITELASLVRKMRMAQDAAKIFFGDERKAKAKDLEDQVDKACTHILLDNQQTLKF